MTDTLPAPNPAAGSGPAAERSVLRRLVAMRWWVLGGALAATLALPPLLQIRLTAWPLLAIIGVSAIWNLVTWRGLKAATGDDPAIVFAQLVFDLTIVGSLLFFSGGATNPLVFMLLPPVAVAALTLRARWVVATAVLAVALYSALMFRFVPLPLADPVRAATLHLSGMWVTFVVSVVTIGWLVLRMTDTLRRRDAQLAAAREQALRDERVLALGTLAAGAAHELGTPLATLAVLADELERDGRLGVEAHADLQLMREQITYCKRIITGLTERAGAGRGEHAERIPSDRWLERLFAEWVELRGMPQATLEKVGASGTAPSIVAEPSLEQGLRNLLDNALRAGTPVRVTAAWDARAVRIAVHDSGPGFSAADLRRAGRESFPAHARGSGVGLLLTAAAAERQGGRLHLGNAPGGGAIAELEIPLATMPAHD